MEQTKRSEVVRLFHKYIGRNPANSDWKLVEYLSKKPVSEVNALLERSRQDIFNKSKNNSNRNATLTSPDGKEKTVVPVGSPDANKLLENGWEIGDSGITSVKSDNAIKQIGINRVNSSLDSQVERDYANGLIDDMTYQAAKGINSSDNFTTGQKILTEKDLNDLAKKEYDTAVLEQKPYYQDKQNRDFENLRNSYADIRNAGNRYIQQEQLSYADLLDKTQKSLRARGLTFSGTSRATLGKQGALDSKGIEGTVPQQRRYNIEDRLAPLQENARDIGTQAERLYGSNKLYNNRDFLNPEGLPDPYKNGIDYNAGGVRPVYLPKKDPSQVGFVSKNQADIEKQKEIEARKRASDRLRAKNYISNI